MSKQPDQPTPPSLPLKKNPQSYQRDPSDTITCTPRNIFSFRTSTTDKPLPLPVISAPIVSSAMQARLIRTYNLDNQRRTAASSCDGMPDISRGTPLAVVEEGSAMSFDTAAHLREMQLLQSKRKGSILSVFRYHPGRKVSVPAC